MLYTQEEKILNGLINTVSERQKVLANNLANVSTPGYVRKDVDFSMVLKDLKHEGNHSLDKSIQKATYEDGTNAPALESELSEMYQNHLKYVMLVKMNGHIYKHMEEATQAGRAA